MTKILVIEDDLFIRENVVDILNLNNMETLSAENGVEGLAVARQHLPDLIVCDVKMPELDGYGVLLELHSDPITEMIPFIFLTARAEKSAMRKAMDLGADDFLVKPFTSDELMAAVMGRLDRHKAIRSIPEKQLEELRGNILHVFPHELRTPLTAVLGYSDMLMSDANKLPPERVALMGERIHKAGQRLFHTIENFLLYSQLMILRPEGLDEKMRGVSTPSETVIKILEERPDFIARQHARENDLTFDMEPIPPLQIAQDSFRKIVDEMVDNACKFSPVGTSILIQGRMQAEKYALRVTDQGRGMTPEQIALIGAYIQFDRKHYEQQGAGLGFVIVQSLVELYGGSFEIDSVPGEGTSVTVSLLVS